MTTSLFNLQSVNLGDHELLIEFYAGDIFDVYSDMLVLSAYKNGFVPVPGTTWGRLHETLGLNVYHLPDAAMNRISENVVEFAVQRNPCFSRLVALEMISLTNKRNLPTEPLSRATTNWATSSRKSPTNTPKASVCPCWARATSRFHMPNQSPNCSTWSST